MNTCGDCTMCCKTLGVLELDKPRNRWCQHCDIGKGCKIYSSRPESCATFECAWLQLDYLTEDDRPDKTGVVMFFPEHEKSLQVHVDPHRPDAWKSGPTGKFVDSCVRAGLVALVSIGDKRRMVATEDLAKHVTVNIGDDIKK